MTSIAAGLPGADLIEKGLRDLERGAETIESLLVSMSAPRLRVRQATIDVDLVMRPESDAMLRR